MSTFIIAEAGVNHNGSLDRALRLVDAAVGAGADAVKFQTFKSQNLVTNTAEKANYQKELTDSLESQFDMLKKLELSHEYHLKIKEYCELHSIEFMSTAFDLDSLKFLLQELNVKRLKIPSGEITNFPLVHEHAKSGLDIILSTGMADLGEIEFALKVLADGYAPESLLDKGKSDWESVYTSDSSKALLRDKVSILHCVTEYPAPAQQLNLKAIETIRTTFGLSTGYSDHSLGIWAPISAVTLGAKVIEKHFTLDKELPGPDHRASLEPDELKHMVTAIRDVEVALGDGVKRPFANEIANRGPIRKSLVAVRPIEIGESIADTNVAVMRPEGGMHPSRYWDVQGKRATKRYNTGDFLDE